MAPDPKELSSRVKQRMVHTGTDSGTLKRQEGNKEKRSIHPSGHHSPSDREEGRHPEPLLQGCCSVWLPLHLAQVCQSCLCCAGAAGKLLCQPKVVFQQN